MIFILFMTLLFAPPQAQGGRGREGGGPVPATGTGVIIGRVVEGSTTSAVAGTVVTITGAGGGVNQRVRVDASGRFLFRDLPVGEFSVVATRSGYVGGAAGQRTPNGPTRPVELAAGERVSDLTLRLWQAGAIAGTIVDEAGEPIVGIKVALAERRLINGRRRLAPSGQNFAATTDDRGMYRFGSVPPGDYYVVARTSEEEIARGLMSLVVGDPGVIFAVAGKAMGGGRPQDLLGFESALSVYPPMFHPSAALPSQATVVTITSGEVREGVDIRMKLAPLARLAGTFAGLGSEAPGPVQVRLVLPDADGSEFEVARAIDTSNGKFDFLAVPSGRYTLRAYQAAATARTAPPAQGGVVVTGRGGRGSAPPLSTDPSYWASMPLTLNGLESQNVSLMMQRGFTIRGRIEFDGAAPRPEAEQLDRMIVTLAAEDPLTAGMNLRARVESDGTFRTASVPPGKYRLRVSPVGVWTPKSAMVEGRDVIDEALDVETTDVSNIVITLSDRPLGSVSGSVRTARGDPDPDALVAIFPADPRLRTDLSGAGRRLRLARTTRNGLYRIPGLPAGEYLIVAGGDELFDNWLEAGALQALSQRATPIEIGDGTAKNQELKRGSPR